jgi:hypothetical protein
MIFKKYGTSYHSVTPNFDSRAMTEVGFQKSGEESVPVSEFEQQYELEETRELTATADGDVQDRVEKELLESLRKQLLDLEQTAGGQSVLVIASEAGKDYPKTREKTSMKVVGHDNKLHFQRSIDPPLRVAIYRLRTS